MEQIIHGEGRYLKNCKGCKKAFRTDSRNARFGPAELCKCLERRAKTRTKRARERRAYHKNPDHYRGLSRTRAQARKLMLEYLKRNKLEPACAYPGCKHHGWDSWKHILQVHHNHGKELLNPDYSRGTDHGDFELQALLTVVCRNHHEIFDRAAVSGRGELVVWQPPRPSFVSYLAAVRKVNPKRYWMTPTASLLLEYDAATRIL